MHRQLLKSISDKPHYIYPVLSSTLLYASYHNSSSSDPEILSPKLGTLTKSFDEFTKIASTLDFSGASISSLNEGKPKQTKHQLQQSYRQSRNKLTDQLNNLLSEIVEPGTVPLLLSVKSPPTSSLPSSNLFSILDHFLKPPPTPTPTPTLNPGIFLCVGRPDPSENFFQYQPRVTLAVFSLLTRLSDVSVPSSIHLIDSMPNLLPRLASTFQASVWVLDATVRNQTPSPPPTPQKKSPKAKAKNKNKTQIQQLNKTATQIQQKQTAERSILKRMSANLAERHQIKKMVDEIEKRKPGFPTLVKDITQQKLEKYDPIQIQDDLHNLQAARKRVAHLRSELKLLMSEVEQFNKQFSPSPKIDALIRKPENRELVFETNPLSPRQMFDKLPGVFGTKQQQQQQQQPQKSEDPQEMIDTTLDLLRSLTRDELTLKKLIETNATQKMMNLEFIVEESVNLLNVSFPSFKKYLRDHGGNFVLDLDKEDADEEIWDFFLDIDDLVKNMKQHHPKQQRESVTVLTQTVKFLSELSTHPEGCKMLMSEDYLRCLGSMLFVQNDEIKTAARVACENVVAAIWAEEKVKLWKHSGSAFLAGGRGDMSRRESDWMKGWFAPAPPAVAAVEATAAADLEDLQATREETLRFASMLMMMIQVTDDRMLPSRFYDALLNEIRMGKEINDFFTYAPFFALTGWLYGYKQIATSLMNRGEHFASGALTKSATPQQRAILRVVSRRSAFGVLALCIGSIISDDLNERRRMFVGWTPDWKFEKTFAEQKAIFLRNEVLLHTVDNVGLFAICSVAPAAFIAMLLAQIGWTVMPEDFFSGSLFRGCLREIDQVKGDIEEESEDEKD